MPAVGYIIRKTTPILQICLRKHIVANKSTAFTFASFWTDPQKVPVFRFLFVGAVLYMVPFSPQLLQKGLVDLGVIFDGIQMTACLGDVKILEIGFT